MAFILNWYTQIGDTAVLCVKRREVASKVEVDQAGPASGPGAMVRLCKFSHNKCFSSKVSLIKIEVY